jgi:hypothetical protein
VPLRDTLDLCAALAKLVEGERILSDSLPHGLRWRYHAHAVQRPRTGRPALLTQLRPDDMPRSGQALARRGPVGAAVTAFAH